MLDLLLDDLKHRGKDGKLFSKNLLELAVSGFEVAEFVAFFYRFRLL